MGRRGSGSPEHPKGQAARSPGTEEQVISASWGTAGGLESGRCPWGEKQTCGSTDSPRLRTSTAWVLRVAPEALDGGSNLHSLPVALSPSNQRWSNVMSPLGSRCVTQATSLPPTCVLCGVLRQALVNALGGDFSSIRRRSGWGIEAFLYTLPTAPHQGGASQPVQASGPIRDGSGYLRDSGPPGQGLIFDCVGRASHGGVWQETDGAIISGGQ